MKKIRVVTIVCTVALFIIFIQYGGMVVLGNAILGRENPSMYELEQFLDENEVDEHRYIQGEYECNDFSVDLIEDARRQGYKAGLVDLSRDGKHQHYMVAFRVDGKLTLVEPQYDAVIQNQEINRLMRKVNYDNYKIDWNQPLIGYHIYRVLT